MRREDVYRRNGVDKTFNIQLKIDHLDPEYKVLNQNEYRITDTGLMKVIEIYSEKSNSPRFLGRWDEKDELLDIDIYNVNSQTGSDFKSETRGYIGHHAIPIKGEGRNFIIHVEILGRLFFKGEIFFNMNRTLYANPGLLKLS